MKHNRPTNFSKQLFIAQNQITTNKTKNTNAHSSASESPTFSHSIVALASGAGNGAPLSSLVRTQWAHHALQSVPEGSERLTDDLQRSRLRLEVSTSISTLQCLHLKSISASSAAHTCPTRWSQHMICRIGHIMNLGRFASRPMKRNGRPSSWLNQAT